jgi:hypothetical protein
LNEAQIGDNDIIVIETQSQYSWIFTNDDVPIEGQCENCRRYTLLPVKCVCKNVAYCKKSCLEKDKYYHSKNCLRAGEEEDLGLENPSQMSKMGLTGL